MTEPLLLDLGPLSCGCTDHALESLYKALGDPPDDEGIWEPHHDPWLREHAEDVTRRGQRILKAMQDALLGEMGLPEPQPLAKSLPWQRWDAAEFDRARKYLNGIPAGQKTIDDWMLLVDWIVQRYLGDDIIRDEAEYIAIRAAIAGKVRANLDDRQPLTARTIEKIVALLPYSFPTIPPAVMASMTPRELNILQFAAKETAQHITDLGGHARARMKKTLLDGIRKMTLGDKDGTWGKLQQTLLDDFGTLNRDYRRIAITETGNATNTGFIAALAPGTQVRRKEAYRGACPYCTIIRDRVLTVVADDKEPKDWDTEVWPSKNNVGRSASPRKRVGTTLVLREPDEMWSIPAGTVHPHCFISPNVPVYTIDGWRPIKEVAVGTMVMTHKGRFRPVDWVMERKPYQGTVVQLAVSFNGRNEKRIPAMTPEHPVLTAKGWVNAQDIKVGDSIISLAKTCPTCGKPFVNLHHPQVMFCSNACAPRKGINQFSTDDPAARAAAIQATAEANRARMKGMTIEQRRQLTAAGRKVMAGKGYSHLSSAEGHKKGNRAAAMTNYRPNETERAIADALSGLGIEAKLQYRAEKTTPDSMGRKRYWFIDIAVPAQKIAIEIDGEFWHPKQRDQERDEDLSKQGWSTLRYDSVTAKQNPSAIADGIGRLALNHEGDYRFAEMSVTKATTANVKNRHLYNFGVSEDESYIIAGGIVVHNCRGGWAVVAGGDTGVSPEMAAYVRELLNKTT